MTQRLKDELETLSKWRTVIQNLPEGAAPTPPAQEDGNWINEDEVNALVRQLDSLLNGVESMARQATLCDIVAQVAKMKEQEDDPYGYLYEHAHATPIFEYVPSEYLKSTGTEVPLYTRPADDKLRKAADEAIEVLQWYGEERMVNELRAALEGNPTPSNTDKPYPG